MRKVKVLITDDSATMRAMIKVVLSKDPKIEVVGEAEDPYDARDKIKELNPDVLTLDIEMPKMSGLEFLKKIMKLRPMPVIMLSSLTKRGARDTIEALSIGAFDCVAKPVSGDYIKALSGLPELVKAAALYRPIGAAPVPKKAAEAAVFTPNKNIVAIGSSTGGVEALIQILSTFPDNCPPTIITQHMPASFLAGFAARLDRSITPKVSLASDGAELKVGQIYLAPGGDYHLQIRGDYRPTCSLLKSAAVSGHRPSVDVMFSSIAKSAGARRSVGVILTGMGRDGAKGLLAMRQTGAKTLGQDQASCVVYGMPRAAHEIGAVQDQLALSKIGAGILSLCQAKGRVV